MQIKLTDVRLFFPDLFTAVQFDGQGEFRFGATFGVAKGSAMHKLIESTIKEVAKEGWKGKADAMLKSFENNANKYCYMDGDTRTYSGAEGLMVLSARRKKKDGQPLILLADKTKIVEDNGEIYSGCYVNAKVDIWPQTKDYPGVRCTLLGVQFNRHGDAFSGAAKASDNDFETITEGADAADIV